MNGTLDDLARLLQGYLAPVIADGWSGFSRIYWYFVWFEAPRFLLLDVVVLAHRTISPAAPPPRLLPSYAVVVPVLNEAATVPMTLRSLEEQSHPPAQVVIVDDGSTDATAAVCARFARGSKRITFLRQGERSGKSAALNRGLQAVREGIVVFVDSDTTFDRTAMAELIASFADPGVVAVGGALRVRNRHENLLTECQAIEYGQSIALARQAKSMLGVLPIVSGAFGAFRSEAVRAVGGHDPGPGNDSDLTIDLRERGGRIVFAHRAVCHTDVPAAAGKLTRQRRRWCRNVVKNRLRKHRTTLSPFNRWFSWRNAVSTLDPILYQVVFGWIWVVYMVETVLLRPSLLPAVLIGNAVLYTCCALAQQLVVVALSERRREDLAGLVFVPAFHVYRVYLRLVMLFAQLEELFTRTSRRDPFAPAKVQRAMPDW